MGVRALGPPSLPRRGVDAAPVCVAQRRACLGSRRLEMPRKPPKATLKPYTRHRLGIDSGPQSHPNATPRPLSSQLIRPVSKSEAQKPPFSSGPWPQ
jgi:hypothetical protein